MNHPYDIMEFVHSIDTKFHFQANESFAKAALACLSTLTLRSKENSQALFEAGSAETIVETMKLHTDSKLVTVKFTLNENKIWKTIFLI